MSEAPDDAEREIRQIMADLFAVDASTLDADASPDSIEAWDSLQHVNLVLDLESRFGIQLSEEDVEAMTSLGAVVAIVDRARAHG